MIYTADMMLASIIRWGIRYRLYRSDWRTHNRDAVQGWGPYNGHVVHCFGSDGTDTGSLSYLDRGDPLPPPQGRGMPGPLSQFGIDDFGVLWIMGWGAANHCGWVDKDLHALVLKDAAPLNSDFRPNSNGGSDRAEGIGRANDNYSGVEMTYGHTPTSAQIGTVERLSAALMDGAGPGFTAGSVIGHRECTTERSDPTGIAMWQHRRNVNALLKAGPAITITAPQPAPTGGLSMSDVTAILDAIAALEKRESDRYQVATGRYQWEAGVLSGIAAKVGTPVDETAVAQQVLAGLAPQVADAIKAAVDAGVPTDELADAVVAKLGQRLNPPAPTA